MKIIKASPAPQLLNGVGVYAGRHTNSDGGSARDFVIDNIVGGAGVIIFAKGFNGTTVIEPTEAAGTNTNTRKLTFAVPASGVLQYIVIISNGYSDTSSAAVATTVSKHEVY